MPRFLTDEGKTALTAAIRDIESRSSAEIVIAVRERSVDGRPVEILVGVVLGYTALAFQLFSRWTFPLESILLGPAAVGMATLLACGLTTWSLYRRSAQRRAAADALRPAPEL